METPQLVVALDIGSTYSGYAWQWREDFERNRGNIEMNTHWEFAPIQIIKTKTCVLIKSKQQLGREVLKKVAIGHQAEKMFTDEPEKPWFFFKEFKLLLFKKDFSEKMEIDDVHGRRLPLFEVMSIFIKGLRKHFLKKMGERVKTLHSIRWVITVPAIWPLESRNFMRKAAEHSGIDSKSLLIALEPEVAAIYCLNLPLEEKNNMGHIGEVGQTFLTADLGGGTADLTAVKVKENGQLDIICEAQGKLIGGQNINSAFFQAIHESFEGELWGKVFSNATEVLEMEDDFEQKKVNIVSVENAETSIKLTIPTDFRDGLLKKEISMTKDAQKKGGLKIHRDKLFFNPAFVVENFFEETCNRITNKVKEVLESPDLQNVKVVVLVGGLSESNVVVSKITAVLLEMFPSREIKVVVPTSPFRAVLTGAVLFGHNPDIVRCRSSPATFGIETNSRFDAATHRVDKKWTNNESGLAYCKDMFSVHIRERQHVVLKERQPTKTYYPINANQTNVSLPVYMHKAKDELLDESAVVYTTDDRCTRLGEMLVKMPDTTGGTNRKVAVTMTYGVELGVSAVDETSKETFEATMEYRKYTDSNPKTTC